MLANKGTLVVSQHLFTGKQHYVDYSRTLIGPQRETSKKKASEESEFFQKNCCLENQTQGNTKRQSFLFYFII